MKRPERKHLVVSSLLALGMLLGPRVREAMAAPWRTMHVSACKVISAAPGAIVYNSAGQIGNNSTTTPAVLICPLDGDNRTRSWDTSQATVTLSGYSNGANGIQAKACETFPQGGGGTCTATSDNTTAAGVKQLSINTALFGTHESPYLAFLWVQLGAQVSGSSNTIWGYTLGAP